MKRFLKTTSALLLAAAVLLGGSAFASADMGGEGDLRASGESAVPAFDVGSLFFFQLADGYTLTGEVDETGADDFLFASDEYDLTAFHIHGDETRYPIGGGSGKHHREVYMGDETLNTARDFDAVIDLGFAGTVDSAASGGRGVYVTDGGFVTIDNAYIFTSGAVRSAVYNPSGTVVIRDSYLGSEGDYFLDPAVADSSAVVTNTGYGRTRTFLSDGTGVSYIYNSDVYAQGWASLSTDAGNGTGVWLYVYGTTAVTENGGYINYADHGCHVELYGDRFYSADQGVVVTDSGEMTIGAAGDATEAALAYLPEDARGEDVPTVIEAGMNALVLTGVNMANGFSAEPSRADDGDYSVVNVSNATLRTSEAWLEKNLRAAENYYSNRFGFDLGAYYMDKNAGAAILFTSTDSDLTLTNVTLESYNDTVIRSVLMGVDPMNEAVNAGETTHGMNIVMNDMDVTGNIVHEDYQRVMSLTLHGTTLTGAVQTRDVYDWNAWCQSLAETDPDLYALVLVDDIGAEGYAYGFGADCAKKGLSLSLDADSAWVVTGASNLTSLTLAEGAALTGAEGRTLTMTVDGVPTPIAPGSYAGEIALTLS